MINCHKLTKQDIEVVNRWHQGKCTYLGHGRNRCKSKPVAWVYVSIDFIDVDVDHYTCRKHLLSMDRDIARAYKLWLNMEVKDVERQMYAARSRITMFYHGYKYI